MDQRIETFNELFNPHQIELSENAPQAGRISKNGWTIRYQFVDCCQEFYLANDPEAEKDYYAHNRTFYALVKARGLWD